MKNILTKNLGLKIMSLLFAALMWIIVTNMNDPPVSEYFDNVMVEIINGHMIDDANRVYEVLDNTDRISRVTVRAPRSVMRKITRANIIAQADISDISSFDTIAITLDINNASDSEINDLFGSSSILKLNIEDKITSNIPIRDNIEGEVAENHMMDDNNYTFNPNFVTVSGPASVVNQISYAGFSINISNITTDISTNANINFFDIEGKRILTDRLTRSAETVSVRIPILETKTIPIHYLVTGTPANGYLINGDEEISDRQIEVAGKSNYLREVNEIIIPENMLDLSDRTETLKKDFNLNDFLPPNIRLVEPAKNMITIMVGIEEEGSRSVTLLANQLRITNVPQGFQASLHELEETPPIMLTGLQRDLDLIQPAVVSGTIDIARWMANRNVSQLSEGYYQIPIEVSFGNHIGVANIVNVAVSIELIEME